MAFHLFLYCLDSDTLILLVFPFLTQLFNLNEQARRLKSKKRQEMSWNYSDKRKKTHFIRKNIPNAFILNAFWILFDIIRYYHTKNECKIHSYYFQKELIFHS